MCQLINIICQMVQEVDYLNAKTIIYRGIEVNNIFLCNGLLLKTGNFCFGTGKQWELAGIILSR